MMSTVVGVWRSERERGDIKEKYGTIWLFKNFAVYFKSSGKPCRVLSNKLHDLT